MSSMSLTISICLGVHVAFLCSQSVTVGQTPIPPRCDSPLAEWTMEPQRGGQPEARSSALSAKTPEGDLWLFGGWGHNGPLNDMWIFENKTKAWKPVNVTGNLPESRWMGHACYYKDYFVIFGGESGVPVKAFDDVWMFSVKKWEWINITLNGERPSPRAAAAYWCVDSKLYIFGGYQWLKQKTEVHRDMWILPFHSYTYGNNSKASMTWKNIMPSQTPTARYGSMGWVGTNRTLLYLFGGVTKYEIRHQHHYMENDMWLFSTDSLTFTLLQTSTRHNNKNNLTMGYYGDIAVRDLVGQPGGRMMASTWIDDCGYLWLFSGQGLGEVDIGKVGTGIQSDLWYYIPVSNVWISSGGFQLDGMSRGANRLGEASIDNFPGSRWMCTTWSVKNEMYLFGGFSFGTEVKDLWRLTWRSLFGLRTIQGNVAPNVYMRVVVVVGILLGIFTFLIIARKCLCKRNVQERFAEVKYRKLQNEQH